MSSQIPRGTAASDQFTRIYARNFKPQPTKDQFDALFKRFGHVAWSVLREDQPGQIYGHVEYLNPASAVAAIEALHNKKGEWSRTGKIQVLRARTRQDQRPKVTPFENIKQVEAMAKDSEVSFIA